MTSRFLQLMMVTVVSIALESPMALGQPGFANATKVPPDLQVPAGNTLFLKAEASGTQNYICLPTGSGFAWTFTGPQATLYLTFKWFPEDVSQQIATHFLSPNPEEDNLARATWQHSLDTSRVWAKLAKPPFTDPNYVAPGAIPWLLLEKAGTQRGPTGGSILAQTTYIQRLNTSGGVMPATGCSEVSNVGTTAMVPYTADYLFYQKERQR